MNKLEKKVMLEETPVFIDDGHICRYSASKTEVTLLDCLWVAREMRRNAKNWIEAADELEAFVQSHVDI